MLEHFPAKCAAVRRRKCDKCKNLERVSDSKGTETALGLRRPRLDPGRPAFAAARFMTLILSNADVELSEGRGVNRVRSDCLVPTRRGDALYSLTSMDA